jgi:hypothetical protein
MKRLARFVVLIVAFAAAIFSIALKENDAAIIALLIGLNGQSAIR